MAATKRNAMLIEETRKRVQTNQLINRLHDHAVGKVEMSQTQVRAAEILLRKSLPDLSSTTIEGGSQPIEHLHRVEIIAVEPEKHGE